MFAHSSSTSRSGGSSGFPVSVARSYARGDDLLDERREQRLEAALLVRGRAEVGRVAAAVEEALGAQFGRQRRGEDAGVGVGGEHRLGGRVDASSGSGRRAAATPGTRRAAVVAGRLECPA